jgi:hypothetical protein
MGTTLDGQTLTVTKWAEGVIISASQWDAWSSSQYTRKVKVYGLIRTYIIDCVEQDVVWANSLANYFQVAAGNGNTVLFYSDLPVRPVNLVPVLVLNVTYTLENLGGKNIRKFTLTLQEESYSLGSGVPPGSSATFAVGAFTIVANTTSIIVTHSLGVVPTAVVVSPITDAAGKRWIITSVTSTQFVASIDSACSFDITFNYVCA